MQIKIYGLMNFSAQPGPGEGPQMKFFHSLLIWIVGPRDRWQQGTTGRKAMMLSSFLFLFAMAMNILAIMNLLGLATSSPENARLLYFATIFYSAFYFLSRTKYHRVTGSIWLIFLVSACFIALRSAQDTISAMMILQFGVIAIVASGVLISLRSTILLLIVYSGAIFLSPNFTPYLQMNQLFVLFIFTFLIGAFSIVANIIQEQQIHEIRQRSEMIESQRAEIIQASNLAAIGEVAGGIAHEINNPLAIIQGHAYRLQRHNSRSLSDEIVERSAKIIEETCTRLVTITRGILELARGSQTEKHPVPLREIFENAVALSLFTSRSMDVTIKNLESDPEVYIYCDANQMTQVFLNIFKNAIDAFRPDQQKRWIHVSWKPTSTNSVQIDIANNGEQIPPEVIQKITTPFFTTKETKKGTGLGLSISKKIVNSHNGRMELSSTHEKTVFTLFLPANPETNLTHHENNVETRKNVN